MKPKALIVLSACALLLALALVSPYGLDLIYSMAGYYEITFDMLGQYSGVEAQLVPESGTATDARASSASSVAFYVMPGTQIKYITWNTDQTTAKTLWLHYTPQGDTIIDATGAIRAKPQPICSYGDRTCSGDLLQGCSSDGTAWQTISACQFGCDPATLQCSGSPLPQACAADDECGAPPVEHGQAVPRCEGGQCSAVITCDAGYAPSGSTCVPSGPQGESIVLPILAIVAALALSVVWVLRG